MTVDTVLWIAVGLFVPAAFIGATLANAHWRRQMPPFALTAAHGVFVAGGIVALFIAAGSAPSFGWLHVIIGVFLLAATGGVTVLAFHIRKRSPPRLLLVAHAGGAVTAFVLLLLYVLKAFPS